MRGERIRAPPTEGIMRASTLCAAIVSLAIATAVASAQTPTTPGSTPGTTTTTPGATPSATDKQAISKACSDQANAKGLHGKERKKFRAACKKRGGAPA
jgi:psiF repeat